MNTDEKFSFREIDIRQQKRWEKANLFKTPEIKKGDKKFYCLDMFPYPSGQGLHVGHPEGYTATDILCRYKRMLGYKVLHPMGWDAFGLPAENYAIETGIHPEIITNKNIETFKRQIKSLGLSYDWQKEISTTDPSYYKWTQWIFLKLYEKGLAYEANVAINWCPSCKTGLANEEVFGGKCERCQTPIEQKKLRQWMLKITAYAQRLLDDLKLVDWPHSTLTMQQNWIGRSQGAEINFPIAGSDKKLNVFTTRPDTIFGATYMVIAPEHKLLNTLTTAEQKKEIEKYIAKVKTETETERLSTEKEKTGVFTGSYAINPATTKKIPIWTADYVSTTYATGAIMAVPAHDERDFDFAKKFGLDITQVIKPAEKHDKNKAYTADGTLINSGFLNGLSVEKAIKKANDWLEKNAIGGRKVIYKLRDWVFSRQRYWGEPIPIVHCDKCATVPIPESELPLKLPPVKEFKPTGTGESPLANIPDWVNTKCPKCNKKAKRETNTMPQWAGSCWYYLRYLDPGNDKKLCDENIEKLWMPVDCYIGGTEHAVLHLLYARFWHKVLYDLGVVSTTEPFKKLRHQGVILSYSYRDDAGVYRSYDEIDFSGKPVSKKDKKPLTALVEKMSKSKKNVINPDEILEKYGADTFRMYEMFMGPFESSKPWDTKSIEGVYRFLKRVWLWVENATGKNLITTDNASSDLETLMHKTIAKVGTDIEELKFNTAISALMIYFNELIRQEKVNQNHLENFLKLLCPLAPHITEELWQKMGKKGFLACESWPIADDKLLESAEIEIVVQVNGKLRGKIKIASDASKQDIKSIALENEKIKKYTQNKEIVKIIVVAKKLINIVVR